MPLALDPESSVWVSLRSDEEKPDDIRPEFRVKVQAMRGQLALMEFVDSLKAVDTQADLCQRLTAKLSELVVETRNMGGLPLEDVLTDTEAIELIYAIRDAGRVSANQKKKSESQPPSDGEPSVKDAPPNA